MVGLNNPEIKMPDKEYIVLRFLPIKFDLCGSERSLVLLWHVLEASRPQNYVVSCGLGGKSSTLRPCLPNWFGRTAATYHRHFTMI